VLYWGVRRYGALVVGFLGKNPLSVKFFLLPQRQNVNMSYIIMGKADRLPPY